MPPYFTLPLPETKQRRGRRGSTHKGERKRKRSDASLKLGDERNAADSPVPVENKEIASFTANELAQIRLAGLCENDEIPGPPFPHAEIKVREPPKYQEDILAELGTPLFNSHSRGLTLREQHLSALVTIIHRCLLKGDYGRAGRAWGLLIRSYFSGKPIDPRSQGLWGIGAEILLQIHAYVLVDGATSSNEAIHESPVRTFTEEGFKKAREYYERLILQYPFQVIHKNSIDASSFYPGMLALWIYEVSERAKNATRELSGISIKANIRGGDTFDSPENKLNKDNDKLDPKGSRKAAIKREELRGAKEIAERLDKVLSSPPLDNNSDVIRMGAMVHLWIGDLLVYDVSPMGEDVDSLTDISGADLSGSPTLDFEGQARTLERRTELQKAQELFEKARTISEHS